MTTARGCRALPSSIPPLWELGHLAWFAEWFVLRQARGSRPGEAQGESLLARADAWFDSNTMPHAARWSLDLPAPARLEHYCLAMESGPACAPGEIAFAGGELLLGGPQSRGFVFDNEKQAFPCPVAPFEIDAGLVSNADYLAFVCDGGYRRAACWSQAGWDWLAAQRRHVSLHEAEAYCRWSRNGSSRRRHATRPSTGVLVGVDGLALPAVSRLRRGSLPGVFGAVFRQPPGLARRIVRDAATPALPAFPQFLPAGTRRHLRRLPYLRGLKPVQRASAFCMASQA